MYVSLYRRYVIGPWEQMNITYHQNMFIVRYENGLCHWRHEQLYLSLKTLVHVCTRMSSEKQYSFLSLFSCILRLPLFSQLWYWEKKHFVEHTSTSYCGTPLDLQTVRRRNNNYLNWNISQLSTHTKTDDIGRVNINCALLPRNTRKNIWRRRQSRTQTNFEGPTTFSKNYSL